MDIYWRGGIPGSCIEISQGDNMLVVLLYAVLPIFNPYLWRRTQTQKEQAARKEARHRTDSVIDALGMVFRVLGDGPGGDKVHEECMGILSSAGSARSNQISSRWAAQISRLHLAYTSPTPRLYLAYISPVSPLHLQVGRRPLRPECGGDRQRRGR